MKLINCALPWNIGSRRRRESAEPPRTGGGGWKEAVWFRPMADTGERPTKWPASRISKLAQALRVAAYLRKKAEAAAAKKKAEAEKAAKAAARNRTYVQKMLSLPKLIFTEQVGRQTSSESENLFVDRRFFHFILTAYSPMMLATTFFADAAIHAARRGGGDSYFFYHSNRQWRVWPF